jgi:hypothetical protein
LVRWIGTSIAVVVVAASGCNAISGDNTAHKRVLDLAHRYLRAAARGDNARLCSLRTDGALRRWGGRAACERRAQGMAFDPPRAGVSRATIRLIDRQTRAIDPRTARIVEAQGFERPDQAVVMIDFGKASIEDGHAVGGQIIEMHVRLRDGAYKVSHLNTAVFAD